VKKRKIGRNDPCPCGSGKKYKNCCFPKRGQNNNSFDVFPLDREIHEAGMLSLEHNEKSITDAIQRLRDLMGHPNLTKEQKLNIKVSLAQAYQRRGEHKNAIEALDLIDTEMHVNRDRATVAYVKNLRAISYNALGLCGESCRLFDEVLNELDQKDTDPKLRAIVYIEAGKAFRAAEDNDRARKCWEEALEFFADNEEDIEHYARVKANLGFMLLDDPDESKQEEGVKILEEVSYHKGRIGDLEGLANNYCNLGLYYWKKKRYERAIAFIRKDLYLSRKVGDLRAIATTLCNLAALYSELKQLSSARKLLKEARQIADTLKDYRLSMIVNNGFDRIDEIGRDAGKRKLRLGHSADCACGSGKKYQECCGRADFEPIDIPIQFDGISEDLEQIEKETTNAGKEPSRLDFILRKTKQSQQRLSWYRVEVHDGWMQMSELPDMANHYLTAARTLSNEASAESNSTIRPLSCIVLSVCALEAFINQVTFFLHEIRDFYEAKLHTIPPELSKNVLEFQRYTELTVKWKILGKALCGDYWPPPQHLMTDFQNMIYIRNELTHFKASDYEQVVPPAKITNVIMRRVPESVEIRDVQRAWPFRILTPSFAIWCVNVAQSMIDYFKESYRKARLF
jgi:uncharacterized protein YecA (UPF0149 family)